MREDTREGGCEEGRMRECTRVHTREGVCMEQCMRHVYAKARI
jgi:hypothetical protein